MLRRFGLFLRGNDRFYLWAMRRFLVEKLLTRYVPSELFERPKMGFGVPIDQWLRKELRALMLDYLSPERLRKEALFNQNFVEKKIKEQRLFNARGIELIAE